MRKPFTFKIPFSTFIYNIICKSIKLHYCKSIKRACVAAELSKCEILKIQTNSHQNLVVSRLETAGLWCTEKKEQIQTIGNYHTVNYQCILIHKGLD